MTAWKIGYMTAPAGLLTPISKAHQYVTFTTPRNFQVAVTVGLNQDDSYFIGAASNLQAKRDRISRGLKNAGFDVMHTEGTYFINVDIRSVNFRGNDVAFCEMITREAGVAGIPLSTFYQNSSVDHSVRFCFAKQNNILDEATTRLKNFFKYNNF
jgi:aspartate/methionine/tyrosine aminotransferase